MAYFRTGTNDFSVLKYTNLEAANVKNGVTVTIKDSAGATVKSVAGTYQLPVQTLKGKTYRVVFQHGIQVEIPPYNYGLMGQEFIMEQ